MSSPLHAKDTWFYSEANLWWHFWNKGSKPDLRRAKFTIRQFINQKASSSFPFVQLCMLRLSAPTAWMNYVHLELHDI